MTKYIFMAEKTTSALGPNDPHRDGLEGTCLALSGIYSDGRPAEDMEQTIYPIQIEGQYHPVF